MEGERLSLTMFLVACQTEAAACLNHMLDYKSQRSLSLFWRVHHVGGYQPEDDHHHVYQIVGYRCSILASTEGGEDEEDCKPDDDLIPHEHSSRTKDEGNEAGSIGFLLLYHFDWVVKYDVVRIDTSHISTIYK